MAPSSAGSSVSSRRPNPFQSRPKVLDCRSASLSSATPSVVSSVPKASASAASGSRPPSAACEASQSSGRRNTGGYPASAGRSDASFQPFEPVDALGQPAVLPTPEPQTNCLIREDKKLGYTDEEWTDLFGGAAGVHAACHIQRPDALDGGGSRKVYTNSHTVRSCMAEVAFNRTDVEHTHYDPDFEALFQDAGGRSLQEQDLHADKQGKKMYRQVKVEAPTVIFNEDPDMTMGARFEEPVHPNLFMNSAGKTKHPSVKVSAKKTVPHQLDSAAGRIIYGREPPSCKLMHQHALDLQNQAHAAGQPSHKRYR